jgi:hypothetical protein
MNREKKNFGLASTLCPSRGMLVEEEGSVWLTNCFEKQKNIVSV